MYLQAMKAFGEELDEMGKHYLMMTLLFMNLDIC